MIALSDIAKQKRIEAAYLDYRLKAESNAQEEESEASPSIESESEEASEKAPFSGKALVVDDEEVLRMVLQSILTKLGFETVTASDGEDAMRLYGEIGDSVSLAIVDMNMPGLDGGEVYRRVRESNKSIPILVTSGLDEFDSEPFGDFDDNSGFLMKPFGASEVRIAIEELFGETLAPTTTEA